MIGEDRATAIIERAIGFSRADQTEALLLAGDSNLTRFANSAIHQNVAERNATLHLRLVLGKRLGQATTNDLSDGAVQRAVMAAYDAAKLQGDNPDFVSLPGPAPVTRVPSFRDATASCSPEQRAAAVGVICRRADEAGLRAAGAYSTDVEEIAVANSLGIRAYHVQTLAEISTVVMSSDSSGYAYQISLDATDIDAAGIANEAVDRAQHGRQPVAVPAGKYEVILEPYAVQDIVAYLGYLGLNALALKEQRSFIAGNFGKRLVGPNITLYDDGLDPGALPLPFDFEGVPKQRVTFFDQGIVTAVVYDSYLAAQEGKASTGHAVPSPIVNGPLPLNMFLAPGNADREGMIRAVKRGLLVTRFWYTRPVEQRQVIVTGMTRDGTFLVENGELVGPVKNLRFTQGYLEALRRVEAISRETKTVRENGMAFRVPTLHVSEWDFVSTTDY